MSNKRVIEVLKRARNLIAKGWTQGPLTRKEGGKRLYCAWGALTYATKSERLEREAREALNADRIVKAFTTRKGVSYGFPYVAYNEHHGRKQSQVVALFDRTIARLEKQQQASN